jgi:hypothetical protein
VVGVGEDDAEYAKADEAEEAEKAEGEEKKG